nr:MAG TPA: hypothetical protein [Caudoviricetes sp.]
MFLERIELLVLVFSSVRLLTLALILMHMNIRADILIRFVLGTLFIKRSKLLYKVASLAHKQHNKLWQVLLMLLAWQTRRISKICFHLNSSQHSSKHSNEGTLMAFPSSVELIKRAFNAYVVQPEKCV